MLRIDDVMNRHVVTLTTYATLGEAATLLAEQQIGSAPVVNSRGEVEGVISEFALMDLLFDRGLESAAVVDFMSRELYTLSPRDSLTRAIHMFVLYGVHRLPVVEERTLVGIVTRRDLLEARHRLEEPLAAPLEELVPELATGELG
jgi:CBS domain-containing membrane protein